MYASVGEVWVILGMFICDRVGRRKLLRMSPCCFPALSNLPLTFYSINQWLALLDKVSPFSLKPYWSGSILRVTTRRALVVVLLSSLYTCYSSTFAPMGPLGPGQPKSFQQLPAREVSGLACSPTSSERSLTRLPAL